MWFRLFLNLMTLGGLVLAAAQASANEQNGIRNFETEHFVIEQNLHHEISTDPQTQNLIIQINKNSSIQITPPSSYEVMQNYDQLNELEKQIFQQKRLSLLSSATRAFHAVRLSYGTGSLVKAHLKALVYKYKGFRNNKTPLAEILENEVLIKAQKEYLKITPNASVETYEFESFLRSKYKKQLYEIDQLKEGIQPTDEFLKDRSLRVLANIITALDEQLWKQPRLVVQMNEYGWVASTGPLALSGWQQKGKGGFLEFGISIGFNMKEKAFVFEIFRSVEKFKDTKLSMIPVGLIGLQVKTGPYVASRNHADKSSLQKQGTALYTPVSPSYIQDAQNYYNIGFSTSFGLPPGSDIMSYSTHSKSTDLLKIRFSKLLKGFVRLNLDPSIENSWTWTVHKVKDFIEHLNEQYNPFASRLCRSVLIQ